jgi:hypothetical protein
VAVDALLTVLERGVFASLRHGFFAVEMRLAAGNPALAFSLERTLLLRTESADALGFLTEKCLIVGEVELAVFDIQIEAPQREVAANAQQFFGADRVEPPGPSMPYTHM